MEPNEVPLTGEWHTPWRVAIIGTLADIVESTLVTDVSEPTQYEDVSWIEPGVVSWIYWANNHGSNDYNIIKKYVDMAATLGLPYVLIDAEWDEMKDGKTVEDAIAYDNYLCNNGYSRRIRTGTFKIPVGSGWEEIADIISTR